MSGAWAWAALGTGLFLLAVVVGAVADLLDLTGTPAPAPLSGRRVTATVVVGASCDAPGADERVRFTLDGSEREARFDGCGHVEGEPVEIALPADLSGEIVVSAAQTVRGEVVVGKGLGALLLVVSAAAGAAFVFLLRRA
ncbi:hypothetical protein BU204_16230 [Actinophytocola xanthii]|uniref:Uncharacterized protein n=1 Tax=Actinophytocola xanthii TaxID=1912961 RepID=A0A1Q8CQ84_9PSEU|nr:hypothetical protein BU204_16230 [Actinophytocola xanthii]